MKFKITKESDIKEVATRMANEVFKALSKGLNDRIKQIEEDVIVEVNIDVNIKSDDS